MTSEVTQTVSECNGQEAKLAHYLLNRAIRAGTLQRLPCELCGDPNSHGHHTDYSKPLDVRWLCPSHHRKIDAESLRRVRQERQRRLVDKRLAQLDKTVADLEKSLADLSVVVARKGDLDFLNARLGILEAAVRQNLVLKRASDSKKTRDRKRATEDQTTKVVKRAIFPQTTRALKRGSST